MTTKSSFSDFASKHGKDERFKGVDKMRDRENLFNDFIANLKRRERDEKNALKDKVSIDVSTRQLLLYIRSVNIHKHLYMFLYSIIVDSSFASCLHS